MEYKVIEAFERVDGAPERAPSNEEVGQVLDLTAEVAAMYPGKLEEVETPAEEKEEQTV